MEGAVEQRLQSRDGRLRRAREDEAHVGAR
jgi:hypothetical protein